MRKIIFIPVFFLVSTSFSQTIKQFDVKRAGLPNGWSLAPAGKSIPLGDLPLNMAVSPSKKIIAVTNNGQSVQSLQLIDAVNDKLLSTVEIKRAWYGLKFSADGKSGSLIGVWTVPLFTLNRGPLHEGKCGVGGSAQAELAIKPM